MTAPLSGIRVVELASYVAAPAAGALLADLGADVIKVEIRGGELYRFSLPKYAGMKSDFPESPPFHMDNRGKRSLVLDLAREDAQAALRRVIASADIVLTNMLPHRLEKYGIAPTQLRAQKPELIVATLSGYGHEGADARTPAFDYTAYWARTGFMDQMRDSEAAPAYLRPGVGDHAAALSLTTGILSALRMRDQTGEGQVIDVSLLHVGFYIQGNDVAQTLVTGEGPPRHNRRRPRNPLWNPYCVKGGRWIFLVMIESQPYWPKLCRAIDAPELLEDPRFDAVVPRYRNASALVEILDPIFASRTLTEWEGILDRHGLIWAPVRTLAEAVEDPQAAAAGAFATIDHPSAGSFQTVRPPLRMSGFELPGNRPGPSLGAHTKEILSEIGLEAVEIDALDEPDEDG